jgi:cytochrome P450/NADPH-cytochrome P450 reductase
MSIWQEKTGGNADAASKWIDEMGQQNRYVLDVWAGG